MGIPTVVIFVVAGPLLAILTRCLWNKASMAWSHRVRNPIPQRCGHNPLAVTELTRRGSYRNIFATTIIKTPTAAVAAIVAFFYLTLIYQPPHVALRDRSKVRDESRRSADLGVLASGEYARTGDCDLS